MAFTEECLTRIGYLYTITNKLDGKFYIGITSQKPSSRWSEHKSTARRKANSKSKIVSAIRKYGAHNFVFKVELILNTMLEAGEMEIYLRRELDPPYNIHPGGQLGPLGIPWSDETRALHEKRNREAGKRIKSPEAVAATVAFHTGRKRPQETCDKIGASKKDKPQTPEAIENNRQSQFRRWELFFQQNPEKKGRRTREQRDRENEQARARRKRKKEAKSC
jgi:group I intron endonuclease